MTGRVVVRVRSTLSVGRLGECAIGEYAILMNTMMVELLGAVENASQTYRESPTERFRQNDRSCIYLSFISDVGLYDIGL